MDGFNPIQEGGFATWSTLAWGFAGLCFAAFFAARPTKARWAFVKAMQLTIFGSAMVGTLFGSIGVTKAYQGCNQVADCTDGHLILVAGLGEALNNLALGFVFITLIAFVSAFGRLRQVDL